MNRVFKGREEEELRLNSTLEGQYIKHFLTEMDSRSNLPDRAWGDLKIRLTESDRDEHTKCYNFMTDVVTNVRNGKGLYIHGGVGTGKSTWTYKIARRYLADLAYSKNYSNKAVYFANVPELMNNLKQGFNDPQYLRELNYLIENSDLVIFDDIGAENITEWAKEQLYHYINYRYANSKATIFTSNLPHNSLEDRVADRIRGMTDIVHLQGPSRR